MIKEPAAPGSLSFSGKDGFTLVDGLVYELAPKHGGLAATVRGSIPGEISGDLITRGGVVDIFAATQPPGGPVTFQLFTMNAASGPMTPGPKPAVHPAGPRPPGTYIRPVGGAVGYVEISGDETGLDVYTAGLFGNFVQVELANEPIQDLRVTGEPGEPLVFTWTRTNANGNTETRQMTWDPQSGNVLDAAHTVSNPLFDVLNFKTASFGGSLINIYTYRGFNVVGQTGFSSGALGMPFGLTSPALDRSVALGKNGLGGTVEITAPPNGRSRAVYYNVMHYKVGKRIFLTKKTAIADDGSVQIDGHQWRHASTLFEQHKHTFFGDQTWYRGGTLTLFDQQLKLRNGEFAVDPQLAFGPGGEVIGTFVKTNADGVPSATDAALGHISW